MSYIGIDFDKNNEYYIFSNDKIFTRTRQIYMMHDCKNIHIVTEAEESESDLPKKSNSFGKSGLGFKKNTRINRDKYDNRLKNRGNRDKSQYIKKYNNHNKYDKYDGYDNAK